MPLKLMYITNRPEIARIAEDAGVDRIFVDMEYIGKADRQGGMNTVQSHHTIADIHRVREAVTKAELLVRVNPIHQAGSYLGVPHTSSEAEINAAIEAGADILMLPYFKTIEEAKTFAELVDGRAKTMLLLETAEAAERAAEFAALPGIDSIHIGINDLCLSQKKRFMFELLSDGTVETLCGILKESGKPYGFGGIARPGSGMLPAEYIIGEHVRLGSGCVILSRSFCNTAEITDLAEIRHIFEEGVPQIRAVEKTCAAFTEEQFAENQKEVALRVNRILDAIAAKNRQ